MARGRMDEAVALLIPSAALAGHHSGRLADHLRGHFEDELTEFFLETLLHLMAFKFSLDDHYQEKIRGYRATLSFRAGDGVHTVVQFVDSGHMHVDPSDAPRPDTVVEFTSPRALRDFLLSGDQDIIASLLNDEVVVRGNLNHVNRFGALAAELVDALL